MNTPPATHHVVYLSDATHPMPVLALQALLLQARAANLAEGLTGLLFYSEGLPGTSSAGSFLQVLEGDAAAVHTLVDRIRHDSRNVNLQVLIDGPAPHALFSGWSMGFATIIPPDMEALLGCINPRSIPFMLPHADAISERFHECILKILAEYPSWPPAAI